MITRHRSFSVAERCFGGAFVSLFLLILVTGCGDFRGKLIAAGLQNDSSSAASTNSTPGPTPDPSPIPFNAKVFNKNAVFAAHSAIAYTFGFDAKLNQYTTTPNTAVNFDSYLVPVTLGATTGGLLQNSDINVKTDYEDNSGFHTSTLARAQADAGGFWNFSSVNDPNHQLGQVMAYYWIEKEKETANAVLANSWAPTGKNVSVYTHCYDANSSFSLSGPGLNALWAGLSANYTCLSYLNYFEAAFDASVYVHEMGHANVDYGTNGQMRGPNEAVLCPFDKSNYCCSTNAGCARAINEGQADVHAYIVFNSGQLGEFFLNNTLGLPGRNAALNTAITAQGVFAGTAIDPVTNQTYGQYGQEIHQFGSVWGASWWTLRLSLGASVADKIFFAHLPLLTSNDNFSTALQAIITADQTLVKNGVFAANHKAQIQAAFSQHGIM